MSARRRRFNEPSPVEFGPALLGVSPRENALGAPEGSDVLTGRTAATADSTHSESVLGASSLAASDIPQLRDGASLLLESEEPGNDAKTAQLASSLTTMIVSRRSGSFRNLVSASGSVAVAVTPRRMFGRSDDSTTPPPTPSQLANKGKGAESDDVEVGELSLHPYTPLLHIGEDESDVHADEGRSSAHFRLQTPQQQQQQRTPPRQLPPITHHQQRTSPEPQSSLSTSSAAPPRRSELTFPSELCCPVCLDPFHTPVTLSCSHNVCHEHILDLAAAVAPGGVLPRPSASSGGLIVDSLHIQCPKCREPTVFPNGMQSVHVNVEMKALVDMMVVMLSQQQQQQHPPPPTVLKRSGTPGGDVGGSEGGGSGRMSPSSRPQSSGNNNKRASSRERGGKPRAVRFTEEDIVLDDAHDSNSGALGDGQAQPPRVPPPSALKKSSSAPDSTSIAAEAISTGVASARKLEQQLRLQREQLREERERQAKEKLEEFKKQRREEIERRKEEAETSAALLQKNDDQPSPPLSTPGSGQRRRMNNISHRGADDDDDDDATRQRLQSWLNEGADDDDVTGGGQVVRTHHPSVTTASPQRSGGGSTQQQQQDVVARHLQQLELYEAGGVGMVLPNTLTSSTKARRAEERIQHLFRPLEVRSQEDRLREREEARRSRELELQKQYEAPDEEVELRMWEVERKVLREHDDDLSREQMAEIAEARARAQIAAFRKQTKGGQQQRAPVAKATYVPKMQRLQKF